MSLSFQRFYLYYVRIQNYKYCLSYFFFNTVFHILGYKLFQTENIKVLSFDNFLDKYPLSIYHYKKDCFDSKVFLICLYGYACILCLKDIDFMVLQNPEFYCDCVHWGFFFFLKIDKYAIYLKFEEIWKRDKLWDICLFITISLSL